MRHTGIAALALLSAAGTAAAQVEGEATWLWDVTTQNGDAIVEPGETATVTLSIDMEPDVNGKNGPVVGFAAAEFDTLGMANADNGHIVGWDVANELDSILGDLTTTDGVSLFGTATLQFVFNGPFSPDDPIAVLALEWAPDEPGTYDVHYMTRTLEEQVYVWVRDGFNTDAVPWPVNEAEIAFQVVPGPGRVALAAVAGALLTQRRKRTYA